jgi:tetratricopeptide (TPR) repeat protein
MSAIFSWLTALTGILALLASLLVSWFAVPAGFETTSGDVGRIVLAHPFATLVFKALCIVALCLAARSFLVDSARGALRVSLCRIFAGLLAALLFFPCCTMTWSPSIGARASALYAQHDDLTWLGGDVFTSQEFSASKEAVFVTDSPRASGVFPVPEWSWKELETGRLAEILCWLGYTPAFSEFVNKGWFLALAGVTGILFSLIRKRDAGGSVNVDAAIVSSAFRAAAPIFAALLLLATAPCFIAGAQMQAAKGFTARGDYASALVRLDRATAILPVLRRHLQVLLQRGALLRADGRTDAPEAALYAANLTEQEGFQAQAGVAYTRVLEDAQRGSTLESVAVRAVLRAAINDLNSGETERAAEKLRQVLERDPNHLKANYVLQLACLRLRQRGELAGLVARMEKTYAAFQTPQKASVLSGCHQNLSQASLAERDLASTLEHFRRAANP